MQIVIDIPYGHYLSIKDGYLKDCIKATTEAIMNGTILPKEHGNLIDYYDAVELINNKADEENSNFTINDIEKFGALLREVNPIIEAYKEQEI
jgi:hypothetical protein